MNKYGFSLSDVSSLLEALDAEQMQNKIANSGSDTIESDPETESAQEELAQTMNNQEEATPEQPTEEPQDYEGLDDASYLQNNAQMTQTDDLTKQKRLKLFDLFKDLYTYNKTFYECLETIDTGLLETEDIERVNLYLGRVKEISEKINAYILNGFENDKYEKELYIYILLRTELLTCIKSLRKTLKLNEPLDKQS